VIAKPGDQLPVTPVQSLSNNGSAYTAEQTRLFAWQIGFQPVTTPVRSPKSNGMAESLVKTIKRDYVAHMPKPDRETALRNRAIAFEHYNEQHPHSALNYRSPREFRRWRKHQFNGELVSGFVGASPPPTAPPISRHKQMPINTFNQGHPTPAINGDPMQ